MARYGKHLQIAELLVGINRNRTASSLTCPPEAVPQDGCAGGRSWQIPQGHGEHPPPQHPCPSAEPLRARQRGPVPSSAAVYGTTGVWCREP